MSETKKLNMEDIHGLTVSSKVLAALFSMTDRRVRELENEGIVIKPARGKYDLLESVKRYIAYIKATKAVGDLGSLDDEFDLDKERAMHERIKREQAELKLASMKGTMHRAEDVKLVMNDMLGNFKSKLLNLPAMVMVP